MRGDRQHQIIPPGDFDRPGEGGVKISLIVVVNIPVRVEVEYLTADGQGIDVAGSGKAGVELGFIVGIHVAVSVEVRGR